MALVASEAPGPFGGVERYGLEVARGLVARGHAVTVMIRRDAEAHPDLAGATVLPVLAGRVEEDRRLFAGEGEGRYDVHHAMAAGYAWVAMHRSPVVVSLHGNDFLHPWIPFRGGVSRLLGDRAALAGGRARARALLRRHAGKVAAYVANSARTRDLFLGAFPVPASRVRVAHCGVGASFLAAPLAVRREEGPIRLVTVCRLDEPRKNVGLVLEALGRLDGRAAFEYAVVGEGRLRGELEARARALGIADRVRFTGRVEDAVLVEELRRADLLVLPSSETGRTVEGFGLVYLEANAVGTPVLAARCGGAPEVVEEGVSGLFAGTLTPAGIAEAILLYSARRGEFPPEACRRHAARFTWRATLDVIEAAYRDAAGCGKSGAPSRDRGERGR